MANNDGKTRRQMTKREWDCFEDGVNWERERISKLLADYDFSAIWRQIEWNPDGWESFGSDDIINLIRGPK